MIPDPVRPVIRPHTAQTRRYVQVGSHAVWHLPRLARCRPRAWFPAPVDLRRSAAPRRCGSSCCWSSSPSRPGSPPPSRPPHRSDLPRRGHAHQAAFVRGLEQDGPRHDLSPVGSGYNPGDLRSTVNAGLNSGHRVRRIRHRRPQGDGRAARAAGARFAVQSAFRSYATQKSTFAYWSRVSGYSACAQDERPGRAQRAPARDDRRLPELRRIGALVLHRLGHDQGRSMAQGERLEIRLHHVVSEGQDQRHLLHLRAVARPLHRSIRSGEGPEQRADAAAIPVAGAEHARPDTHAASDAHGRPVRRQRPHPARRRPRPRRPSRHRPRLQRLHETPSAFLTSPDPLAAYVRPAILGPHSEDPRGDCAAMAGPEPARGIGLSVATMVINADGTTADASPAALELLGLTLETPCAAAGCPVADLRIPQQAAFREQWEGQGSPDLGGEATIRRLDGSSVRVKFGITPIEDGRYLAMLEPVAGPTRATTDPVHGRPGPRGVARRRTPDDHDPAGYRRMARHAGTDRQVPGALSGAVQAALAHGEPRSGRATLRSDRHPDDLPRVRGGKGRFARWRRPRPARRPRVRGRRPAAGRGGDPGRLVERQLQGRPRDPGRRQGRPDQPAHPRASTSPARSSRRTDPAIAVGSSVAGARLRPRRRPARRIQPSTSACRRAGSCRWRRA